MMRETPATAPTMIPATAPRDILADETEFGDGFGEPVGVSSFADEKEFGEGVGEPSGVSTVPIVAVGPMFVTFAVGLMFVAFVVALLLTVGFAVGVASRI